MSSTVDYRQSLNVAAIMQIINPLNNTIPDISLLFSNISDLFAIVLPPSVFWKFIP